MTSFDDSRRTCGSSESQKTLSFADFQKIELKIGKILSAEPVAGSDKLLKLEVDLGEEKRQLAAGIADCYTPDELIGKNIVVVVNLEPKKLRGVLSQGMLLAADVEKPVLLVPDKDVEPGTKVR